ncbi:hypothetical protein AD953_02880 [Acetobacter malorum]|uniref:Uncharacterized protein n=1 Tax=Acetobacter malorum TaxID=178901 RepID=A0A149VGF8_9PROT|nr:hypothetical protein AD953_02880 [Acetobacter malorum]
MRTRNVTQHGCGNIVTNPSRDQLHGAIFQKREDCLIAYWTLRLNKTCYEKDPTGQPGLRIVTTREL